MSVEVSVLDLPAAKKWRRMWLEVGERVHKLPKWMQDIVLEDINTAIKNRVATMEMIQNAKS